MVGSLPCPQIRLEKKKMEVTNALASYEMAKITAVNSPIVQALGVNPIEIFGVNLVRLRL
jgi:hypothetical protein